MTVDDTARRWRAPQLAHSLELGAACVVAASEGRPGVAGAPRLVPSKVYGETALLCRGAARVLHVDPYARADHRLVAAYDGLRATLDSVLDADRAHVLVAADPAAYVEWTFPHAMLGEHDPRHRAVALELADLVEGPARGNEPAPLDRLERAWLHRVISGTGGVEIRGSVLDRGADLLSGRLGDAYDLTHAVLHATDQGRVGLGGRRSVDEVLSDAEALVGQGLCADNHDVTAELLWAWPMLGRPLPPTAAYALEVLADRHRRHGFLPGPEYLRSTALGLAPRERGSYVLQTSYHTAVVTGILAAALLCRPTPRAVVATGDGADPMPLFRHADGLWAEPLRRVDRARRADLAPLVVSAELRMSCARREFADVRRVLSWACDHGWSGLPVVVQGAELLSRLTRIAPRTAAA